MKYKLSKDGLNLVIASKKGNSHTCRPLNIAIDEVNNQKNQKGRHIKSNSSSRQALRRGRPRSKSAQNSDFEEDESSDLSEDSFGQEVFESSLSEPEESEEESETKL